MTTQNFKVNGITFPTMNNLSKYARENNLYLLSKSTVKVTLIPGILDQFITTFTARQKTIYDI